MSPHPSSAYETITPAIQYRKPVRGSLVWWLRFVGVTSFLLIFLLSLARSGQTNLLHIDLRWVGLAATLTALQVCLDAFVWYRLLAIQRIRYAYAKTFLAYLASQYLGLVTPNHVGELLAAGHISVDTGITFGYGLSSVVMKKALSVATVIGFGIWSLPLLAEMPFLQGIQAVAWSLAVLVTFSAGISLWVVSLRRLGRKWERVSPGVIDMTEFWAGIRSLMSPRLVTPLAIAALAFSLLFIQLDFVARSLGIGLPLILVAKMMALSRITGRFLPLSFVGFGSKDAILILLLVKQGIHMADAITIALLFLMCSHLVTLLLSGLCWRIKPLVIRRVARASS